MCVEMFCDKFNVRPYIQIYYKENIHKYKILIQYWVVTSVYSLSLSMYFTTERSRYVDIN